MILRPTIALAACSLASGASQAQLGPWSVRVLGSPNAYASHVFGGEGGQQVGISIASWTAPQNAALWNGTAASFVNLHPAGADWSKAVGVSGIHQYGTVVKDGRIQASRWSGTADSWISLTPSIARESWIVAAGDGQQVGYADTGVSRSAYVWSGTAESATALPGATLQGVGGGAQVGYDFSDDGWFRAALWRGTPESKVVLHPAGATYSQAFGTDGASQVGYTVIHEGSRPALWRGSAASWVDLSPTADSVGMALATVAGFQVGQVYLTAAGTGGAAFWNGTPESYEDLDALLPTGWSPANSWATSAWIDGDTLYVGGYGFGPTGEAAVLWSRTIPAPGTAAILLLATFTPGMIRRRRARSI